MVLWKARLLSLDSRLSRCTPRERLPQRLPQILNCDEVTRLLAHGGDLRARTLLTTT